VHPDTVPGAVGKVEGGATLDPVGFVVDTVLMTGVKVSGGRVMGATPLVVYFEYVVMSPTAITQYASPSNRFVQFASISGLRK
jgi:hypothetical protein